MSLTSQHLFSQTRADSQHTLSLNATIKMNLEVDYDEKVPEISEYFKSLPDFQIKSRFEIPQNERKSKRSKSDLNNKSIPNKMSLIQQLGVREDRAPVDIVLPFSKTTHSLNISKDSSETKDPQPSQTFKYTRAAAPQKLYPIL